MVSRSPVVETDQLAGELLQPNVVVLDARAPPATAASGAAHHPQGYIPRAVLFDPDNVAGPSNRSCHLLPDIAEFENAMNAIAIGNRERVIVYDAGNLSRAARVWWLLRAFGHENVVVLNGGFKKWLAEKRPVVPDPAPARPRASAFGAVFKPNLVRDRFQIASNIEAENEQVVDARSNGRFSGSEPEPRRDLRSGHIPGSSNLPSDLLLDSTTGRLKAGHEVAEICRKIGIDPQGPIVTTCGSGVAASLLALSLALAGNWNVAVYNGSWNEWGGRGDTPIALGA
jgi:thiosulfate/3-mercaptopyruvate sulfurtransferase